MHKSIILPLAKEDIREATQWYNKQSPELGKRFTEEVREGVRFIKQNPTACGIRYDEIRTAVLKVFPFMIHYTIDEVSKAVIISAVLHTSQDPKVWKRR